MMSQIKYSSKETKYLDNQRKQEQDKRKGVQLDFKELVEKQVEEIEKYKKNKEIRK